ncbi:hypothetical protein Pro02_22110 [Planobispora rosea]|uniref:Uncharacterized protein n=1 Tax=Planobispora rosea TaxID=35762 RepID=A0A8J3S5A2_PLARO|nr:hypothetical protein Pro02_22110 [Planobispora rosea]
MLAGVAHDPDTGTANPILMREPYAAGRTRAIILAGRQVPAGTQSTMSMRSATESTTWDGRNG